MMNGYYIPTNEASILVGEPRIAKTAELRNKFNTFCENTKIYYLSRALHNILEQCLDGQCTQFNNYAMSICENFVREEGYSNLMRRFKNSTYTLATIEECVQEACDKTIDKTDKGNPLTFNITVSDQNKFFDSLKGLSVDHAVKKINERVCDATEEFIQNNINKKLDIEELAAKTKERIDTAKEKKNEELANKIQQEQMATYKRESARIKSTANTNVLEQIINGVAKCVLENEEIRSGYINESGKLDMDKVNEQAKVMYTFLEMVNTMKIKKVDKDYIHKCLSSIS